MGFVGENRLSGNGRADLVVVADTSFLIALNNYHLWALDALLWVANEVRSKAAEPSLFVPPAVAREYDFFFRNKASDEFGITKVHRSLEQQLDGSAGRINFPKWISVMGRPPAGIEKGDLEVITSSIYFARQGAEVYVVSSDFKDVVNPLRELSESFERQHLSVTVVAPSPIYRAEYFQKVGWDFTGVVTGGVIRDLQNAEVSPDSQPFVVFERDVVSGNARFNAGVGVVQKPHFRPFQLPADFDSICGNYSAFPVIRVRSWGSDKPKVVAAFQELRRSGKPLELVVVDESEHYFPSLVSAQVGLPHEPPDSMPSHQLMWRQRKLFRADLDFLYYQTNSKFARAT